MVDVDQLRAVKAVAESGSITAAARELGMSQPGLSRLIERIEDELDASLFVRGRKGAELTADGRKFLDFARSTLGSYDMLRASVSGNRRRSNSSHEVLRIVASTTPGEYLLPSIANDFTQSHAGVAVETLITDSAGVATLLMTGEFDAGFAGQQSDFGVLHYSRIAPDEIVLAVPTSHPFADRGEIDVSELEGEKLLPREDGSGTYRTVEATLKANGKELPGEFADIALGSTQAMVSAVNSGVGIGFVTLRAIEHYVPESLAAVRLAGVSFVRDLYLVYEVDRQMSDSARAFIEFVEQMPAD